MKNIRTFKKTLAFMLAFVLIIGTMPTTAVAPLEFVVCENYAHAAVAPMTALAASTASPSALNLPTGNGIFLAPVDRNIPDDAVRIETEEQLRAISNTQGIYYYLANDIHLTQPWTPLATFRGTLDGQGFSVYNVFFSASHGNSIAFVGSVPTTVGPNRPVTIRNLGLNFAEGGINLDLNLGSGNTVSFGGFFGHVSGTTIIENSYISGNITAVTAPAVMVANIGGFVGNISGSPDITIRNSYTAGDICITGVPSTIHVGGMVASPSNGTTTIENSFSVGEISAVTMRNQGSPSISAGRFIGQKGSAARATISDSFVAGNITALAAYPSIPQTNVRASDLIGLPSIAPTLSNTFRCPAMEFTANIVTRRAEVAQADTLLRLFGAAGLFSFAHISTARGLDIAINGRVYDTHVAEIQSLALYQNGVFVRNVSVEAGGTFETPIRLNAHGVSEITFVATLNGECFPLTRRVRLLSPLDVEIPATTRAQEIEIIGSVYAGAEISSVNVLLDGSSIGMVNVYSNHNFRTTVDLGTAGEYQITVSVSLDDLEFQNTGSVIFSTHTLPTGDRFIAPIDNDIPENARPISTEGQLRAIAANSQNYYVLTTDIHLTLPWTPIPSFRGTLDGQGFSINNLFFEGQITGSNFGLFGETTTVVGNPAVIRNLGLNLGEVNIYSGGTAVLNVGGFLGHVPNAAVAVIIENSFVTGDINVLHDTVASGTHNLNVGGFVGNLAQGRAEIRDSYTNVDITATFDANVANSNVNAGGFFGVIGTPTTIVVSIEDSYALGNVTAINNTALAGTTAFAHAGGLTGQIMGSGIRPIIHNTFVFGDITARTATSGTRRADTGDLIGRFAAPEAAIRDLVVNSFHASAQLLTSQSVPIASHVINLAQPAHHFTLRQLSGGVPFTFHVPARTGVRNVNVSGRVVEDDISQLRVYLDNEYLRTVNVGANSAFSTTVELGRPDFYDITVSAVSGGEILASTRRVEFYDPFYDAFGVTGFYAYSRWTATNLVRPDGTIGVLTYFTRQPITFAVDIDVPADRSISEVNLIFDNGVTFPMHPANASGDRWIFVDRAPVMANYQHNRLYGHGRVTAEIIWNVKTQFTEEYTEVRDVDMNAIIRNIIRSEPEPERFRNSLLMPNSVVGPGLTTNAYILRSNQEPNSGAITRNSAPRNFVQGFRLYPGQGNGQWYIDVTEEAVGRTFVFFAHENSRGTEVIIATVNAAGRYPVGRSLNHFYFYTYEEGGETRYMVIDGYVVMRNTVEGRYRFIIDPSGYVYEAVLSNRLQGVRAEIFKQGVDTPWNAEDYFQLNPQITNAIGHYAWYVPEGYWQVRFEKYGFEPTQSIFMPVPPEHLEVHIGMVSLAEPQVERVSGFPTGIEIAFDKFMCEETLIAENFTVTLENGDAVDGEILLLNRESNFLRKDYLHGEIQEDGFPAHRKNVRDFASVVRFVPATELAGEVTVSISENVASYADVTMAADYTATVTIVPEPTYITATNLRVGFGETDEIIVTVGPIAAVEGKTITAVSDNPFVAEIQTSIVTVDANGNAAFEVNALLPGSATITFALEGTRLEAQAAVIVAMPECIRVADMWYVYENDPAFMAENPDFIAELLEALDIAATESPAITSENNHSGMFGIFETFQVEATGFPAPTFALDFAPQGVTINPTSGVINIAGATAIGEHEFTIIATNGTATDAIQSFTLTITELELPDPVDPIDPEPAAPRITSSNAPAGTLGITYGIDGKGFQFVASGFPAPTWTRTGSLPPGLSLTAQGLLHGTPTQAGRFTFILTAANGINPAASRHVTVVITEPTLTVSTAFASPGDEDVTVQIRLSDNPGFSSMALAVNFPAELTLTNIQTYSGVESIYRGQLGDVTISDGFFAGWMGDYDGFTNFTGNEAILTLTFDVDPNAELHEILPVTAAFKNAFGTEELPENTHGDEIPFRIINGGVNVRHARIGDLNGDGRVTSADATLLARHIVRHIVNIDLRAADINCDGDIDVLDLLRLSQALVGNVTHLCNEGGCVKCE
ncbi:MAG: dockerin type I domain-containing protein [Defluviitaleaceae bacterium]|nr:dockerin type I domain-containing protein [Defluviitaleaceae bacterium]MCL2264029.1 dockerin type I domain-containing protein [Defluviitaleaceae bacterium]